MQYIHKVGCLEHLSWDRISVHVGETGFVRRRFTVKAQRQCTLVTQHSQKEAFEALAHIVLWYWYLIELPNEEVGSLLRVSAIIHLKYVASRHQLIHYGHRLPVVECCVPAYKNMGHVMNVDNVTNLHIWDLRERQIILAKEEETTVADSCGPVTKYTGHSWACF